MLVSVYLHKKSGKVLLPSTAQTEAGYWLEVEPVESASAHDSASIVAALRNVWARGTTVIPTPTRATFPRPVVLDHSGQKSLKDFEKKYVQWTLEELPGGAFQIQGYKTTAQKSSFEPDASNAQILPAGTPLDEVFEHLAERVKRANLQGGVVF